MFMGMLDGLKEESVGLLFNAQVQAAPAQTVAPVAAPPNLAQFAADAAAKAQEASAPAVAKGAVATEERPQEPPPALRVKGIVDDAPPPLTYTGPSEDGSAEVQRQGGRHAAAPSNGGTRRERREAARKQARGGPSARRG
jgi:preprotein translocase subunit SecA